MGMTWSTMSTPTLYNKRFRNEHEHEKAENRHFVDSF